MSTKARTGAAKWVNDRLPILSLLDHMGADYPTPKNLNYFWNFGSLAGLMLVIMILSGLFLAMNYAANDQIAFGSVQHIMRDVNYGWLVRYLHANGASFFFITVFIHIARGLYYGSYKPPRELLWWLGLAIMLIMMATAFMGYVLPWGQMSFWGATVITNLFGAFPVIGHTITTWLWGGFSVGNPTLNRFYALHFLLPFVLVGVVVLHIWALHTAKSNNPLGIDVKGPQDTIPFHPYYTVKDLFGVSAFLLVYLGVVFFAPNMLADPDNFIPANPLVTPPHIVPEWYFLPFYAILRSVPDKLLGVIAMFASILILAALPWLDTSKVRSCNFRPLYRWFVLLFIADAFLLGWCGAQPVGSIPDLLPRAASVWYFVHILIVTPLAGFLEKPLPLPESISSPVTGGTLPEAV